MRFQFYQFFSLKRLHGNRNTSFLSVFLLVLFVWKLLSVGKICQKYIFSQFLCWRQHNFTLRWDVFKELKLLKLANMCQVWWHFDVPYSLKIVIKPFRMTPKNNLVCKILIFKTHTHKQFQTWQQFFLETSDYVLFS